MSKVEQKMENLITTNKWINVPFWLVEKNKNILFL